MVYGILPGARGVKSCKFFNTNSADRNVAWIGNSIES